MRNKRPAALRAWQSLKINFKAQPDVIDSDPFNLKLKNVYTQHQILYGTQGRELNKWITQIRPSQLVKDR